MSVQPQRHRFSIDTYDEMVACGILTSDDRVELLAGEIIEMSPIGSRHAACVKRLNRLFSRAVADRAIVGARDPVALPPHSEPEPDLTLLRPREDFYAQSHPRPGDVLLLVEVAESSLEFDRTIKLPLYAAAGIPEMWVVDLTARTIEVCARPADGAYVERRLVGADGVIALTAFPDIRLRAVDILGPVEDAR
ncbi:MAG TPA: Uma2 family endonuclease [Candidatus Baltobacteraceae bacterium]